MRKSKREPADPKEVLYAEVLWTAHHFNQLKELYLHSPARNRLLQKSAGSFFDDLFYLYVERVIIGICRVTDASEDCLTFRMISSRVQPSLVGSIGGDVLQTLQELEAIAATLKPWRNKILAHVDWKVALAKKSIASRFNWKKIDRFFRVAEGFFELIGTESNSFIVTDVGGGVGLLVVRLNDAVCFEALSLIDPKLAGKVARTSSFQTALTEPLAM